MRKEASEQGILDEDLVEAVEAAAEAGTKRPVRARTAKAQITAEMVGFTLSVFDGLRHILITISEDMVGSRLMDHLPVRAQARFSRVTPRKLQRYADLIRGKSVAEAKAILHVLSSPSAAIVAKVVDSAAANADNNLNWDKDSLVITDIFADDALVMPRFTARARGMPFRIRKCTSHLTVYVAPAPSDEEEE
jgi:large subunit ribosomal protein L22